MYNIFICAHAAKYYKKLDPESARRVNKAIDKILQSPFEGSHIKMLKGQYRGKYRYAVGDLRIVYRVDEEQQQISIDAIGPRGDIYK